MFTFPLCWDKESSKIEKPCSRRNTARWRSKWPASTDLREQNPLTNCTGLPTRKPPVRNFTLSEVPDCIGAVIMDLQQLFFAALGCLRVPLVGLHPLDGLWGGLTAEPYQALIEDHGRDAKTFVNIVISIRVPNPRLTISALRMRQKDR